MKCMGDGENMWSAEVCRSSCSNQCVSVMNCRCVEGRSRVDRGDASSEGGKSESADMKRVSGAVWVQVL